MVDNEHSARFQSSPPLGWGQTPQGYPHQPHSHHGTPAQEYSGFNFSPSIPMEPSAFSSTIHPRSMQPLPQLTMPLPHWPSEMCRQSHAGYSSMYAPVIQPMPSIPLGSMPTPTSATSARSTSTPRRTLTDHDRKRMCQYAEEHPNAKQTDIAREFGVERSTVSKVLRQKEKYMCQDNGSQSPVKRSVKGKSPDIERALSVWAKNQEKKGAPLTDEMIREKVRAFSATTTTPEGQQAFSTSWIEKFKLKYNLMGARSRKGSLAPDDIDLASAIASSAHTPNGTSPISPTPEIITPPTELHSAESHESLKPTSPESFADYARRQGPFHSQSTTSLHSAFTDGPPSSFSPLSPTSPFFTPDSGTAPAPFSAHNGPRPILPAGMTNNAFRPRSQTLPLLENFGNALGVHATTAEEIAAAMTATKYTTLQAPLDSPMEEACDPLMSIGSALQHGTPDRPATVLPSDAMGPPPLPSNIVAGNGGVDLAPRDHNTNGSNSSVHSRSPGPPPAAGGTAAGGAGIISAEEARRAFEMVLTFCEQQPAGFLDFHESVSFGRVKEKLYFSRRGST